MATKIVYELDYNCFYLFNCHSGHLSPICFEKAYWSIELGRISDLTGYSKNFVPISNIRLRQCDKYSADVCWQ